MNQKKQIKEFSKEQIQQIVVPVLEKVFDFPGPVFDIFPSRLSFRIIDDKGGLIPINSVINALKEASIMEGSFGFYYVMMTLTGDKVDMPPKYTKSWYIPWDRVEEVKQITTPLGYAMVSPKGSWGLFAADEFLMVLGATEEIGNEILKYEPTIVEESLIRFFDIYKIMYEKLGYDWNWFLPKLFQHLFHGQPDILAKGNDFLREIENEV